MEEMRAFFADSGQNMDFASANTAKTVYESTRKWYCMTHFELNLGFEAGR